MAAQSLPNHICIFLLMSLLVGGAKAPCEPQLRSRKPPLDSLQWEAYWVPLMIILGGCCAMAWSILFLAYDVGHRGGKTLPQIPSVEEEGVPSRHTPKEMNEQSNLLESKGSKDLIGNPLETKGSRDEVGSQLDRRGSREGMGNQLEIKGSREGMGNQLEIKGSREGMGNQLEIKGSREGMGNQLEIKGPREGMGILLEMKGSREGIGHPLQGENGPTSSGPDKAEDQRCGKLWAIMEKELERLLQLLRFCRSSGPSPLGEGSQAPPGEEVTAPPATEAPNPPAEETPSPAPAQEAPPAPAEETPRPTGSTESPPRMHLIICQLPPSASCNRGRRRQGGSRGRK